MFWSNSRCANPQSTNPPPPNPPWLGDDGRECGLDGGLDESGVINISGAISDGRSSINRLMKHHEEAKNDYLLP